MDIPRNCSTQSDSFWTRLKNLFRKTPVPINLDNEKSLVLSSAQIGLWSWDLVKDVIEWDDQTYCLFDQSPKTFGGNYQAFIELIYPDDRKKVNEDVQEALKKNKEFEIEFRVVYSDKSIHYLGGRGKTYFNAQGAPTYVAGVSWDMTPRRLAEEELRREKTVAENSARAKTGFMAKMSHELRSPLNGIIGFAELMYHGKVGPISNDHKEYLGDILASARHLLLLIDDVLDLSKAGLGKMVFHPETIDLNKIMRETKEIFQSMITTKKIQYETKIDPLLQSVVIDPTRFKQVIYNYVSNALKYTPDGGKVTVSVIANDKDNTFCLEVKDTGTGISKENMPRLFVEFQQFDMIIAKKYPSTGLGLALVKGIVEAQGGKVGAESEIGKGSVFYAILPRTPLSEKDIKNDKSNKPMAS